MSKGNITQPQGWWASNWKWVVPVGCLGVVICFVAFFVGIFAIITGSMKSSWAYTEGVNLATRHTDVVAALGEPIATGWLVSGSISVSGPSGEADLSIPLRGPNGRGTLYVIARKRAGEWSFELAEVEVKGHGDRIDLLSERGDRVSNAQLTLPAHLATPHPATARG